MSSSSEINTQKTFYHSMLEVMRSLGLPFTVHPASTLNLKRGILAQPYIPSTSYPTIKYLAIGRGGLRASTDSSTGVLFDDVGHNSVDAALHDQIPWVIMPLVDGDLDPTTRQLYRHRTIEEFGDPVPGQIHANKYICYWLRVVDINASEPQIDIIDVEDGEIISTTPFDFDVNSEIMQNPVPPAISNVETNVVNGRHISVKSTITIALDRQDINNIVDACITIYGDANSALISEFGVVQGIDASLAFTDPNSATGTFTEAFHAQIVNHLGGAFFLKTRPESITLSYGLADVLPWPPSETTP